MKTDDTGRAIAGAIHARWEQSQADYRNRVEAALPLIREMIAQLKILEIQSSQWKDIGISRVWGHLHEARDILQSKVEGTRIWDTDTNKQ